MSTIYNAFTKDCDKYLTPEAGAAVAAGYLEGTYFCFDETDFTSGVVAFRYPGATRGHVTIDARNVITSVTFYETSFSSGVGVYGREIVPAITEAWVGEELLGLPHTED